MGGKRRRISSNSGRVDDEDEADDFGYDVRLARRWKRRCIAYRDFKLISSSGKNSSKDSKYKEAPTQIPEINRVEIDIDEEDLVPDSDYKEYLDSLDSEEVDDSNTGDSNNIKNGGDIPVEDMVVHDDSHHNDALADANPPHGSTNVKIDPNKERYHNDALADANPPHESMNVKIDTNKERYVDAEYERYFALEALDGSNDADFLDANNQKLFSLESLVGSGFDSDKFFNSGSDIKVVNGSVDNDSGGDNLVDSGSANDHIDDNNNINALGDMDPQIREIPESNKSNCDTTDVDNEKFMDTSVLGLPRDSALGSSRDVLVENEHVDDHIDNNNSELHVDNEKLNKGSNLRPLGDSDVCHGWSADSIAIELNSVNLSKENGTHGNRSNTDIAGQSAETKSANDDTGLDDDLNDPQYMMFLKNLQVRKNSYALEVPLIDGIAEVIQYEMDDESSDRCKEKNLERTRPSRKTASWTKHDCEHKMESDMVDHCYKIFLNSLKKEGKRVVFTPENGPKVVYDDDEDEASSSDSEVIVMDSDPFVDKDYTPFVTSKPNECDVLVDEGDHWTKARNDSSWFKERVIEILRKPYNDKEYYQLLREAQCRKPVIVQRDMRNGRTRQCSTQIISQSYLDLHKDLRTTISSAGRSKPKALNILRGFFYWLKNVAHDGVFKPWMDSSCLEVLPCGSCL